MSHMTAITHCKTPACREAITTANVIKEQIVDGSPQHVVIVYKCPACDRTDKMVGTSISWKELKNEQADADIEEKEFSNRLTKMAHIEVEAINGPDDLISLWKSLKTGPLREAVMGSCQCDDCETRRRI